MQMRSPNSHLSKTNAMKPKFNFVVLITVLSIAASWGSAIGCRRTIAERWRASQHDNLGFQVEKGRVVFRTNNPEALAPDWDEPVNADPQSFEVLFKPKRASGFSYARDRDKVFVGVGKRVYELEGADPKTIKLLDGYGYFASDSKYVYFVGFKLEGAKADSFQLLGKLYCKDASSVFYGPLPLKDADPESFVAFSSGTLSLEQLDFSDGGPFRTVSFHESRDEIKYSGGWAKDKSLCYHGPRKIRAADPQTFKLLDSGVVEDKEWRYIEEGVNSVKVESKRQP